MIISYKNSTNHGSFGGDESNDDKAVNVLLLSVQVASFSLYNAFIWLFLLITPAYIVLYVLSPTFKRKPETFL